MRNFNSFVKKSPQELKRDIENIPEEVLETIMNQSIKDAKLFLLNNRKNKQTEIKDLTYLIYRSFIIGMVFEKHSNDDNLIAFNMNKLN